MAQIHRIRIFSGQSGGRIYALTRKICRSTHSFQGQKAEKDFKRLVSEYEFAPKSRDVFNNLLQIDGVTSLTVDSHAITVSIAAAYDWADVNDQIVSILREAFFEGDSYRLVALQDRTVAPQAE